MDDINKSGKPRGGRVIGVTGAAASGKSYACAYLARERGARLFDADKEARALAERPDKAARIAALFPAAADGEGRVQRDRLREIVLKDQAALRQLEELLYPELIAVAEAFVTKARADGAAAVIDAPLLRRAGLDGLCDVVVLVRTDPAVRRARLLARPGMTQALADALDLAQADVLLCHNPQDIIVNGGLSPSLLAEALDKATGFR